jgi:hypothetical protein
MIAMWYWTTGKFCDSNGLSEKMHLVLTAHHSTAWTVDVVFASGISANGKENRW